MAATVAIGLSTGCDAETDSSHPEDSTATQQATTTIEPRYSLAPTRRCLEDEGFVARPISGDDPRLQELSDLAQRTSLEIRRDGELVGLALGDAELLADLLAVPNDLYTIETHGNAVLLYLPTARATAGAVRRCLGP
jgi:hypothetical protein